MKDEQNCPLVLGLLSGIEFAAELTGTATASAGLTPACESWEIHAPSLEQTRKTYSSSGQEAGGPIS